MPKLFSNARREALQEVLRHLRKNTGLTQTQVAKALCCPQSFVSKYESGERQLDLVELEAVCKALGVTLQELIGKFEETA